MPAGCPPGRGDGPACVAHGGVRRCLPPQRVPGAAAGPWGQRPGPAQVAGRRQRALVSHAPAPGASALPGDGRRLGGGYGTARAQAPPPAPLGPRCRSSWWSPRVMDPGGRGGAAARDRRAGGYREISIRVIGGAAASSARGPRVRTRPIAGLGAVDRPRYSGHQRSGLSQTLPDRRLTQPLVEREQDQLGQVCLKGPGCGEMPQVGVPQRPCGGQALHRLPGEHDVQAPPPSLLAATRAASAAVAVSASCRTTRAMAAWTSVPAGRSRGAPPRNLASLWLQHCGGSRTGPRGWPTRPRR